MKKIFVFLVFIFLISCQKIEDNIVAHFIAHAGGEIDGNFYTNSLEGLNLSYSKGCRLFELDFLETSDGKIVAAHDWEHYKTITNFPQEKIDNQPLAEQEFLEQKIMGKYTPLNMAAVNRWFSKHSDAILVTDKINEPKKFISENGFEFRDRLIMELFSWNAVNEAIECGITPMPSDNLVFSDSDPNRETVKQILLNSSIKYVCCSVRLVEDNRDFLHFLKEKGIKVYVFHVNFDNGIDEKFVWDNYRNVIFGMYADNLDLLTKLK
ncbi:MAG: hypothetical protein LBS50_05285 [Prevotellaceae bacterium]|jgi:glycerophosphoryl diester phosphodiesterase|nr:hypothetical protein [Prevotellaceae bacterium]